MSSPPLKLVVLGLSLSSSWGNGHATTWRSLLSALATQGHDILFLERDVPWYAAHRDLPAPSFCDLRFYGSVSELERYRGRIVAADAVIVGSYVPEGIAVISAVRSWARRVVGFYDIDTPVTLAHLAQGSCEYLAARQIPGFDVYLSFTGGPTLGLLERRYGAGLARALYCSVDPALYAPAATEKSWDLGYLGTYSADRQPALERLLIEPARRHPDRRYVVAGSLYPDTISWPANVTRIDHLPPEAHARFYSCCRATLNVTRADMIAAGYSPSVRLFEAAACATAIVSDRWCGLDEMFTDGAEILIADDADEVCRFLARPDDELDAIGRAGQARVLAAHTNQHRAGEFVQHLRAARRLRAQRQARGRDGLAESSVSSDV